MPNKPVDVIVVSSDEGIAIPLWHAFARRQTCAEVLPFSSFVRRQLEERLRSNRGIWAVIVDVAREIKPADALIRDLRTSFPELPVLGAFDLPDARTVQRVLAAGACDYLTHPFDEAQMKSCQSAWGGVRGATEARGGLVCFLPARPGDGASTVALHAAAAAAKERRARGVSRGVLFVDFDFQASNIAFRLQLNPPGTLADALSVPDSADPPWPRIVSPWRDLDVLASPTGIAAEQLARVEGLIAAARRTYALTIVDMPAPLYSSSRALLEDSDEVYLVCTPEITSVHLAQRRAEELRLIGVEPPRLRLLLNRDRSHAWIGGEEVSQVAGMPVWATLANDYAAVNKAVMHGEIVSPQTALGRQMEALGNRVCASPLGATG